MNISKIPNYSWVLLVCIILVFTTNFFSRQSSNYTVSYEQNFGCAKTKLIFNQVASSIGNATSTAHTGRYEPVNLMFRANGWVDGLNIDGSKTVSHVYIVNEWQDKLDIGGSETVRHAYIVNGCIDMGGSETVNYTYSKYWYNNDGSKTTEFKNELHEKIKSLSNAQIKLYGL